MKLEERKVAPEARLVFTCPAHPEVVSDQPGVCPKDGRKLAFKIVSDARRLVEERVCPMHPERKGDGTAPCPDCGGKVKPVEHEELLAVPYSAVIDTGHRKVVFVERGHGVYQAVEVVLGPRAGEHVQVLKGLAAGERVVSAGAFLLDAEARLNPAAGAVYFGASGGETKR
jgi:hypothetical protein